MYVLDVYMFIVNVALNKPAYQLYPQDEYDASNAVDGRTSNQTIDISPCAVSLYSTNAIWWVNLTIISSIHHITIYFLTNNNLGIVTVIVYLANDSHCC